MRQPCDARLRSGEHMAGPALTPEQCRELADLGATIELTALTCDQVVVRGKSVPEMVAMIRTIGVDRCTVSSDYGWTDAGVLVESGIPCVVFGPTGGGLHTASEWVDLPSVDACARVLQRLARDFCGEEMM